MVSEKTQDTCERCGSPCSDPTLAITTARGRRFCGLACFVRSMQDGTMTLATRAMGVDPGVKINLTVRGPGLDPDLWRISNRYFDEARPSRKTPQHGRAPVIHVEPETELTDGLSERCGCGRHDIATFVDPYLAHQVWCRSFREGDAPNTPEALAANRVSPVAKARGIGISTPGPAPLTVDDPTGDDVARDMSPSEIRAWRSRSGC